jgi:hypothetical protein
MTLEYMKSRRYAFLYPAYYQSRVDEEESFAARLRALGWDVVGLPMPRRFGHMFPDLDLAWRTRDPLLINSYENIERQMEGCDVLVMMGGHMAHPEWLQSLPQYTVFVCADDPESSEVLSKPVAPACDYSFALNIAEVETYRAWGCKNVTWHFYPIRPYLYNPLLTEADVISDGRNVDISIFTEHAGHMSDRYKRIEELMRLFPQTILHGSGWPTGRVSQRDMLEIMSRTKIGWNLHLSTGPINARSMLVPACGVMQICDNKKHLPTLFELGKEVIGFDNVAECADATRYYLAHDDERRAIALAGYRRVMRDYTEDKWWERIPTVIEQDFRRHAAARIDKAVPVR